jgi:hypothetical protein
VLGTGLVAAAAVLALTGLGAPEPSLGPEPTGPGMTITVEVCSPVLGELTIQPPTGTDTTAITVTTSAPCATPSDGFSVLLFGPGDFAGGVPVLAPTGTGFSTTAPITAQLERTLADAAAELGAPLVAGTYQLKLVCLDRAANKASGMFVGVLFLTSPTTYQTTPPPPPTTTTPPATAPPPAGSGGGGSGPGRGLSFTGVAVGTLFLIGLLLSAGGIAVTLASRRRFPHLNEES